MILIVAANIEAEMERQGLTPAELNRRASLGATGVYDIISGKSKHPRVDTIAKIADALKVPVWQLFQEREGRELLDQMISIFERLPAEERRRLLLTARAWLDQASS